MTALTIPGIEPVLWTKRHRFDPFAAELADRHYSREVVGSPQVGGPGFLLVFVSPCERAVWISKRHHEATTAARSNADGLGGVYRCAMFRNEGAGLSSVLIVDAMRLTEELWGKAPRWATYVDKSKVASHNPGYCFKRAGWWRDRSFQHSTLVRLLAEAVLP